MLNISPKIELINPAKTRTRFGKLAPKKHKV